MSPIIGIDLGTTNSAVAYMAPDGPRLIPNAVGERLTPSAIGFEEDGRILVGRAAKELQVLHPERVATVFKRNMGTDWKQAFPGGEFTPEKLSSLVLRSLKEDAEAFFGEPVTQAVITVPAYFHDNQRKATINAGKIAGLNVLRILNEPTAAALAYGLHAQGDKIIVVVDLGGGTFDVSVVEVFEGALEVRASAGESILGGEDFTRTLAARILEQRGMHFERAELEAPRLVSRLLWLCEQAKCQLSKVPATTVKIPNLQGELSPQAEEFAVTREQLDQWTEGLLGRIELPIRRALGDAGLNRHQVDEVIFVGGATRMPMFAERIRRLFTGEPHSRLNPDEVVALGAAVQAALIANDESVGDLVMTDVSPFTLGIETSKDFGGNLRKGYFMPIINRNTTIPVSRVERVVTVHNNQTSIVVKVYQGEQRRVENNLFLGEFSVENIVRGPKGQEIDIRFTYDLNGVLEIEATVVATGHKVTHLITKHARTMTEFELQSAINAMQALKMHPREDAQNRLLLRRAERVYQELSLHGREHLTALLDGFEDALDQGDKIIIERFREELIEFLDHVDPGNSDEISNSD
ncbi:MAG: Hsp70 family protein [Pirellulales bacterium]|nr:Hsp70 family protein [Pirellulales bacterium]